MNIPFEKYTNETGFETEAYILPEAGEYVIQGSGAMNLPAGTVLVRLPRPDSFEYVTAQDWETMRMSPVNPPPAEEPPAADPGFLAAESDPDPVADDTGE